MQDRNLQQNPKPGIGILIRNIIAVAFIIEGISRLPDRWLACLSFIAIGGLLAFGKTYLTVFNVKIERGPLIIVFFVLGCVASNFDFVGNNSNKTANESEKIDTIKSANLNHNKSYDTSQISDGTPHYFNADMVEVNQDGSPLSTHPKPVEDKSSSEYIVSKLSHKSKLSKAEKQELKEARDWIALEKQDEINVARVEAVKNMQATFVSRCINDWTGSCPGVVAYVKNNMNDPSSFEHVETKCWASGKYTIVVMKYRSSNAFGATVTNFIKAKVNSNCQVVEVEAE